MKKIKIIFFFALIFFCNFSQLFSQENTTSAYDFSMEEVIDEQDEQSEKKDTKKTEKLDYENIASPETQDYQIAPTEYSSFNPNVSLLKINDINTTYNRNVYKFTSYFLLEILSPPLIFYKKNVPDTIHTGLKNFFRNMDELSNAMNHILQADPVDAGISIARFAINSTVGILGFIDVSEMIGLSRQSTSMDETLESWYIPPGPFIMLPLLGGGTLRSYTGMVIDSIADPFYWLVLPPVIPDLGWRAVFSVSKSVVNGFISIADGYVLLADLERSSVDPYSTFRNYYLQNKHYQLMKRSERRKMNRKMLFARRVKEIKEDGYNQLSITGEPEKHYSSESIQIPSALDFSMEEVEE